MNRYETACNQSTELLALVRELAGSALALSDMPAIAALTEQYHQELIALGARPAAAADGGPPPAEAKLQHQEAWQAVCRKINKQVRLLDEAIGQHFLRQAGEVIDTHQEAMAESEAEIARDIRANEAVLGPDGLDPSGHAPGRAGREATALLEAWPLDLLDLFALRARVRAARLGRRPAGFAELEALLTEMCEVVPHVLDVSGILADLHRKRTWEEGFYPVLDVQGDLIEAIDMAFYQGATRLASTAPRKASALLASGLKHLPGYRERAEAITELALVEGAASGEGTQDD